MRILMLAQFYPPVIGGEEQHVRNLSAALAARGHEVAVATLAQPGEPSFTMDGAVRVYRVPATTERLRSLLYTTSRAFAPPAPDPETMRALATIVRKERPQIVHAHNWLVHSFIPLKRWSGARLVLTLHDYSVRCAKKRLMYHEAPCSGPGFAKCLSCARDHYGTATGVPTVLANWTMGHLERAAVDCFVPVSQAVADGNSLTGTELPYAVIPNFVPDTVGTLPEEETVAEYTRQLPEEGYLLFVGDLTREKGIHVLLDAYTGLTAPPPLICIGRPLGNTPETLPFNVQVRTNWPHDAVMWAWKRSLIGLVPSVWPDPCPTVAMEAMAVGKPVIAARSGGLPDIVADGETGIVVPPGDAAALLTAITQLLADTDLRVRMGAAGAKRIAQFQAHTVAPRIEGIYDRVLAS